MSLDRLWKRGEARAWGVGVALGTFLVMALTEPFLAIVWDEGYTLGREARIRAWVRGLIDPAEATAAWPPEMGQLVQPEPALPVFPKERFRSRSELFEPLVLAWYWPFAREEPHGHPPFYAIVGMTGDVLDSLGTPLARARLGTMLAFSLTAGAIFTFFARRWGTWPAVLAAGTWIVQPRLFAEGHYATYDALLASLWAGAILAFACAVGMAPLVDQQAIEPSGRRRARFWFWVVLFGVLLGWAADTKLTGWFLALPCCAWTALARDRRGAWAIFGGGLVAIAVLLAFNPAWWSNPVAGVEGFFRSNLSRGEKIPIPVLFLGQVVKTPVESLPWYNTLVWTVFVTPVGVLALACLGAARAIRLLRSEPFGALALGHWVFLLALRALPHTPGHDGVRQFLPAFGCLALVAGLGAVELAGWLGRWIRIVIVAVLVEGVLSIAVMMPVPLSYYSPLVGGLPGATRLGMEPTYYWDAVTDEALDWLNGHTPPGQKVLFASNPTTWRYLELTGRLKPDTRPPGPFAWYVVQNRAGALALAQWDRALIAHGRPSFVVSKLGVPLVYVFPFEQVVEVERRPGSAR